MIYYGTGVYENNAPRRSGPPPAHTASPADGPPIYSLVVYYTIIQYNIYIYNVLYYSIIYIYIVSYHIILYHNISYCLVLDYSKRPRTTKNHGRAAAGGAPGSAAFYGARSLHLVQPSVGELVWRWRKLMSLYIWTYVYVFRRHRYAIL